MYLRVLLPVEAGADRNLTMRPARSRQAAHVNADPDQDGAEHDGFLV